MAGTCPHRLCLQRVDVAAQPRGVGRGVTHGCPGAFGLILRDVHVREFCGGSGGCKESGTSVPASFPSSSSFVKAALPGSRCELSLTTDSSGTAGSEVTGDTGGPWGCHTWLGPHHHGDPPELCPMGASRGPMGVLHPEWGLRAALPGTLLLGHITSQKGCSRTRKVLSASLGALAQGAAPPALKVMTKDVNGYGTQH